MTGLGLAGMIGLSGAAEPVLRCEVRYASEVWNLEARLSEEAYTAPLTELAERFAIQLALVGTPGQIAVARVAVYDLEVDGAPVILQAVRHLPPFPPSPQIPALTGWNHVYSARKGRELVYGCALQEGQS